MNIYKLKIVTYDEEENETFIKDLYLDVDKISGFYIPDTRDDEMHLGLQINIFVDGYLMSILQEPHITKYLTERFVDNCTK